MVGSLSVGPYAGLALEGRLDLARPPDNNGKQGMRMLPGPVFYIELLTAARKRRYYLFRVLYGLALLWLLYQNYASSFLWYGRTSAPSPQRLAAFAQSTFESFAWLQGLTVLLLTPALVAGVIASENHRKTLHYLLASRLSGGEIVLGKLASRLLYLGTFLALGLPVMSLLSLFGGVDPVMVTLTYLGTASTMLFLAGLSVLVSTLTKRPRDAILSVYLLAMVWMALPPLIAGPIRQGWPVIHSVLEPINSVVLLTSPAALAFPSYGFGSNSYEKFAWMVGVQLLSAAAFLTLATLRLRPAFRNEGVGRWRLPWRRREGRRWLPRPRCFDDPMLWKELFVSRLGGFARIAAGLVGVLTFAGVGYGTIYFAAPAFGEMLDYGYGWSSDFKAREFNVFTRIVGTMLYMLIGLGVASLAAIGVTSEREGDTWTSLTTSTLSGAEILRAKMIGAAWGLRWFLLLLALLTTIALAAGALHPFGFVAHWLEVSIYLWFATALGTYYSLTTSTTGRALGWTITTLIVVSGGYLIVVFMIFDDDYLWMALGCSPMVVALSMLSYEDVRHFFNSSGRYYGPDRFQLVLTCFLSVLAYAGTAAGLTIAAIARFDRIIDRPRRASSPRPIPPAPPKTATDLESDEPG
ncbi:hypothetical protein BH23PLA1_BH23PLA1_00260 [soil metagenome]